MNSGLLVRGAGVMIYGPLVSEGLRFLGASNWKTTSSSPVINCSLPNSGKELTRGISGVNLYN